MYQSRQKFRNRALLSCIKEWNHLSLEQYSQNTHSVALENTVQWLSVFRSHSFSAISDELIEAMRSEIKGNYRGNLLRIKSPVFLTETDRDSVFLWISVKVHVFRSQVLHLFACYETHELVPNIFPGCTFSIVQCLLTEIHQSFENGFFSPSTFAFVFWNESHFR